MLIITYWTTLAKNPLTHCREMHCCGCFVYVLMWWREWTMTSSCTFDVYQFILHACLCRIHVHTDELTKHDSILTQVYITRVTDLFMEMMLYWKKSRTYAMRFKMSLNLLPPSHNYVFLCDLCRRKSSLISIPSGIFHLTARQLINDTVQVERRRH